MINKRQNVVGIVALSAASVSLLMAGCGHPTADAAQATASTGGGIAVELLPVQSRASQASTASQDRVRLSGQVAAWRTATVVAQVSEKVTQLPIEAGTPVRAGDLLAALDDTTARAVLAEADAALAQATAGRRQAEAEYARASVETQASITAAQAQVAQSEAGIRGARAQEAQASQGERKARSATRSQELLQAQSALRGRKAEETVAKADFDRSTTLVHEGAIAQQVLDRAAAAYEGAKANREAAEQTVSLLREGARAEDIASATAGVAQADAAVTNGLARRSEAQASLTSAGTRASRLAALRAQIDGLCAQEARASATREEARIQRDKHRIAAPFAGRVLAKLTEVGNTAAAGTPIARIGEIGRVRATFAVPEATRRGLHPGQIVTMDADALPGRTFRGRIYTVGYQADPRSRTFTVEVEVPNAQELLLPSMAVRLTLPAPAKTAAAAEVTAPISAVASDGSGAYVFTVKQDRAVRRPVTLGAVTGESVIVKSGLDADARIVAAPQRLTDGAAVHVIANAGKEAGK